MMRIARQPLRLLLAVTLAVGGFMFAQQGPKKESGDTVARPRVKSVEGPGAIPPKAADQPKIPSKLKKAAEAAEETIGPTFTSDSLNINVDVAVLDNRGRFIPGIPPGNFRIIEDGVPQRLNGFSTGESPMTIAMVIEFSARYQQYWSWGWMDTLQACYGFLETLQPEDSVAVVAFDLRSEILSDFSTNRQDTQEALSRLRIPGFSESNMFDALVDISDRMSAIEGRKAIFYIGSGMDTFSRLTYDETRRKLQTASVPIYSLGTMQAMREWYDSRNAMGGIARLEFLQADNQLRTFAKETGGQAWFPRFMSEYPGIFAQLGQALRNTYTLAYSPTNTARDGKFRKIKVDLINPQTGEPLRITDEKGKNIKYQIIAKNGYQAPREVE
ncbi:MAG TPA: VWA domain-containing protein [Bryobacteraceae bacterium]|nr:VWA domain-containing protein [Bryobacteraceae bacterium]